MELSSKIKAMKFMKRKEDAEERKKMEAQQKELTQQTHWRLAPSTVLSKAKFKVEYDASLGGCGGAATAAAGRHSYRNFNPETEKLHEEDNKQRTLVAREKALKEEKVISDLDMANALGSPSEVVNTFPSSLKRPRE